MALEDRLGIEAMQSEEAAMYLGLPQRREQSMRPESSPRTPGSSR